MHSSRVGCPGSSRWEHAPQDLDRAAMMDPVELGRLYQPQTSEAPCIGKPSRDACRME